MRRLVAIGSALVLVAVLAGTSVAAPPTYRVNHVVGNFDLLDWNGSVVGHVVVNYGEPSYEKIIPGTLDVTWLPNVRFPYEEPPFGAMESHTVLAAGFFGEEWTGPDQTGHEFISSGATGSMCDFGAPWNYVCHDFGFVIELNPSGMGGTSSGSAARLGEPPGRVLRHRSRRVPRDVRGADRAEPPKLAPPSIH